MITTLLKSFRVAALFVSLAVITSCNDDEDRWPYSFTLYAAGNEANEGGGYRDPIVWKNSKVDYFLQVAIGQISGMTGSAGDLYFSGNYADGLGYPAVYWKNHTMFELESTGQSVIATDIAVQDDNVYVSGTSGDPLAEKPCFWKNGILTMLPVTEGARGEAYSIAVSGSDVYVGGVLKSSAEPNVPVYWKNGELVFMTDPGMIQKGYTDIQVSGNDVYLLGHNLTNGMALWKNGVMQPISTSAQFSEGTSIYLDGQDVWITGRDYYLEKNNYVAAATIWKNGIPERLIHGSDQTTAVAMQRVGDDVVVVGNIHGSSSAKIRAFCVVNGRVTKMFPTRTYSVCVGMVVK